MSSSALLDHTREPRARELPAVLGRSHALWERLLAHLGAHYPPLTAAWKCYVRRHGWSLQVKRRKRTVLYMTPQAKRFRVTFVFGDKAVAAARKSGLPAEIMAIIDDAPKYVEGRGFSIEVKYKRDLAAIEMLAAVKMAG